MLGLQIARMPGGVPFDQDSAPVGSMVSAGRSQAPCRVQNPLAAQDFGKMRRTGEDSTMSTEALRALVLEDQPTDAELALNALSEGGFRCIPTVAAGRAAFEAVFAPGRFDVILADYSLPDYTGLEALAHVRRTDALVPFVLMSGALGEERAVEALLAGATDYVLKHGLARLAPAVRRALTERRERERHLATSRALKLSQERLRALSRRLLEVQEDERRSLARDLHDDIGQALTALKIQLESLARTQKGSLQPQIEECVATTAHALERVRQLSLNLRPLQLDDLGLIAALRSHLDRQAKVGGLTPHFEANDAPRNVAPDTETACFRVAQEAINNVLRHAQARTLWMRVFTAEERLGLSVRDDGVGFDLDSARRRAAAGGSLGVVSMEERVALLGGSFELRTAPGQGTILLATFPLTPSANAEPA
jgi:signal transduction histidine kinase